MLRMMKPCLVVYNIGATNTTTCRPLILMSLISSRHYALISATLKLHVLATPLTRLRNRATNSIIGLPEKSSETAAETGTLCVKLFQELGAEVFLLEIAYRTPLRQQNGAQKPIICKFVRRLAKASVMETRQSASQVNPSNIGLSADSILDRLKIFDHLTPYSKPVVRSQEI